MKSSLKSSLTQMGDSLVLALSGRVDEFSNLPILDPMRGTVTFDLKGISFINSVGVANWVRWSDRLAKDSPQMKVELRRVPPQLVKPMNEVKGFLPPWYTVESFYVPYFCPACAKNFDVEYKRGFNFESNDVTKIINSMATCPKCNGILEPDVVPSRYYTFLKKADFSKRR